MIPWRSWVVAVIVGGSTVPFMTALAPQAVAQDSEVQQKLAAVKQAAAANKEALAQYTWQEQQTTSINGQVKKVQVYSVKLGPDGKPVKTPVDTTAAPSEHGIKGHIIEKKEKEYQDYGKQIAALAQSYMQPDPGKLQQLYQQGQVTVAPGTNQLIIHNYVKQGDTVTFTLDPETKALGGIKVASYLSKPGDAVTISADFAQIPNGPNHVSSMVVNGESKKLTVQSQNSNYQKLGSSSS